MSNAQGKELIARLEETSGKTDILRRHLAFEQAITGSPLIVGNKVILLKNGTATYRAMFSAIENADDNINLETSEFMDDPIGQEFADALIAKQRAGVQVIVIYDSFGSWNTPAAFFQRMRDSGIRVLPYDISPRRRATKFTSVQNGPKALGRSSSPKLCAENSKALLSTPRLRELSKRSETRSHRPLRSAVLNE